MKRLIEILTYCVYLSTIVLILFETSYRLQIFDAYLPELHQYNYKEDLNGENIKKTILIMGDSFTAGRNTYAGFLRNNLPEYRVINSGISGTGIVQANITAQKRFKTFNPDIFIYQIFVGNDLQNISNETNFKRAPLIYNVYWILSDYFRSLHFLNYRMGQIILAKKTSRPDSAVKSNPKIKDNVSQTTSTKNKDEFSVEDFNKLEKFYMKVTSRYNISQTTSTKNKDEFSVEDFNKLEKFYIKVAPYYIEDQIMLKGDRKKDFNRLTAGLDKLIHKCKKISCRASFLILPHPVQVNRIYIERYKELGAAFNYPEYTMKSTYPFLDRLKDYYKNTPELTLLDPISILQEKESNGMRLFNENNVHLNSEGQEIIANFIENSLKLN